MEASEIQAGTWYAGKRRSAPRFVMWRDAGRVQYDSASVGVGRRYPIVTAERFAKWAARELTPEERAEAEA